MCEIDRYILQHLTVFRNYLDIHENWTGGSPRQWTTQVAVGNWDHLPDERLSRQQLKDLCAEEQYSDTDCIFAIMAWGGLGRNHGRRLAENVQLLTNVVASLRNGEMTATDAYTVMFDITRMPIGIRPAYYTKLIFFLDPTHAGYIMDQWTAKSINILRGLPIVRLDQGYVSNRNPPGVYNDFCQEIHCLATLLDREPEHIEMALFSEGHRRGLWRQYVIENWKP